jgi:CubicO group peptidase (beta-lactamase class C family)
MIRLVATTLLAFCLGSGSAAPVSESPVLQVFRQWLDAFNSGDSARIAAFWQKYQGTGAEERTEGDLHLRKITGGMKILKVTEDTGTHLVALMQEANGGYSESILDLASTDPLRIGRIGGHPVGNPVPPPAGSAAVASSDEDLASLIRSHVAALPPENGFSGAILVAHNGKVVLEQAWGLADNEKHIANSANTQFCLGSMNKMFTAVAVLQLVQQGKLALDDPIAKYWRDYPNRDLASRVTIRELLEHSGGTGDIFTPEYEAHRLETKTLADYVTLFGNRPVSFDPGTRMEYSNYGFILLGRLIELVTSESYEDYVQKNIFLPAGMRHTDSRPEAERVAGRAIGYTRAPSGLVANTSTLPWSGTSAGGGYSTVHDLLLFAEALQSGKLLSPPSLKEATTDLTHKGYGLGFYALEDGAYGHGGGAPGINGELHILPERGYVLIALANRDPRMATSTVDAIQSMLPR